VEPEPILPASRAGRAAVGAYGLWTAAAVGIPLARSGLSADNRTLLHALLFLAAQLILARPLRRLSARLAPRARFLVLALLAAAVVEGLHMTGMPVFASLRVGPTTSAARALASFGLDLAFTLPAYLVIFSVAWLFLSRARYALWEYVPLFGLGQTLGDGLFFFLGAPWMLAFLPFPMLKYHAMNVLPYLAVRDELPPERPRRAWRLAVPLALVAAYQSCGALIKLVGRAVGLE
jgi:hypothetical protein